ncbi:MAG: S24 family peptidase [Candidatus Cloacimonetes bacterium]|nr:S24 family peptidase [Candidatus Cloacimonadota bacterium]
MPDKEIGERLGKLLKIMRLKNFEFAIKFGISNASLARYKSGDRLPEAQLLLDLCKARVNINWLLTGEGTTQITQDFDGWMKEKLEQRMKVVDSKTGLIQSPTIDYTRTITLPISGEISAGPREDIVDCRDLGETIEIPRTLAPGSDSQYIAFKVNGRSMEPNILHEDVVIIKQSIDWEFANGRVCAVRASDGVTLKKVVLDPANSRIILQPFNMDYSVQIIDPDQGLEIFLIGILSLQLRLFKLD